MSVTVVAQTASGPVVIGSFEDERAAGRFCRQEQRVLRDGGYAEDVTAIELRSGDAGDTQTPAGESNEQRAQMRREITS